MRLKGQYLIALAMGEIMVKHIILTKHAISERVLCKQQTRLKEGLTYTTVAPFQLLEI